MVVAIEGEVDPEVLGIGMGILPVKESILLQVIKNENMKTNIKLHHLEREDIHVQGQDHQLHTDQDLRVIKNK